MKNLVKSSLTFVFFFFVLGCDNEPSKSSDIKVEKDAVEKKEVKADSLSYDDLVNLKNQNWDSRKYSDDGYYSYVYHNDSLIFVEQKLCDQDGYPVDGVYGLYFQPFEKNPCYYTWFSAESFLSQKEKPEFVAKLKQNKIIEILTDTDLREFSIGEEINDNFDLTAFSFRKSQENELEERKENVSLENSLIVGNFEISQQDLPRRMDWLEANQACRALGNGWHLPTKQEVQTIIYSNKHRINDFIDKYYWSSEEGNSELGWIFRCTEANEHDGYNPKNNKYFVRAVRNLKR